MTDIKAIKDIVKTLRCPQDCEKCTKEIEDCLIDLRKSVNFLFRLYLKTRHEDDEEIILEEEKKSSMVI